MKVQKLLKDTKGNYMVKLVTRSLKLCHLCMHRYENEGKSDKFGLE